MRPFENRPCRVRGSTAGCWRESPRVLLSQKFNCSSSRKTFVKVTVQREIGGRTLSLTTGEIAKQASGAVLVQYEETVVLVAAQTGPPRPGIDFFPLTV